MTSAPVKDVGALMNFTGNRVAVSSGIGAESTGNFGDVMNKASGDRQNLKKSDSVKPAKENALKETRVDKSHTRPKASVESRKEKLQTEEVDEQAKMAVTEAGEKLVEETAEALGVSEEEVLAAMETLGLTMAALLNPENLTELVLTISGGDALTLLTDGNLYDSLQSLLQSQQEMTTGLMEEFSLSEADLKQILTEMQPQEEMPEGLMNQTEKIVDLAKPEVTEETAEITVTVEENSQSVKLVADESGNVKQVETVISKETGKQDDRTGEESGQKQSQLDGGKEGFQAGNTLMDQLLQNKAVNTEMSFEQTAAYMAPDTEAIMDQIMDYMKIQVKPGMDQLEMQLHPESLGTLHIQLTSKGGDLTAQFHVQNEAVKAVIESQLVELKEALKDQGVKVEAVEVSVESHAFESNLWQGQGREENASYQGNRKSPRRINLNSLEEGFEEMADEEEILTAKMMEANGNTVDYTA